MRVVLDEDGLPTIAGEGKTNFDVSRVGPVLLLWSLVLNSSGSSESQQPYVMLMEHRSTHIIGVVGVRTKGVGVPKLWIQCRSGARSHVQFFRSSIADGTIEDLRSDS